MNALIRLTSTPEKETDSARRDWVVLLILVAIATTFSYLFFMHQSLRLDEAQSMWQSGRTPGGVLEAVAEDVHVPLYHELLHLWRIYLGDSVESARGMSLLFYVLSIPALYLLGRKAYNRSIGLWGAVLLTFSPFMNWYGNEVRMYTLFMLLTIINQYFFIRLFKDQDQTVWPWYALTAVIGVYSHYFFLLGLLAQAVFYLLNRSLFPKGSFVRFISVAALVTIALIPWVIYVLHIGKAQNQDPHLATPTTVDLFNIFAQFITGFQNEHINTVFLSLWPVTLIFGFLGLRRDSKVAPETHYFLIAVLVPIITAFFISIAFVPLFISRYLILTVPALYLALLSLIDTYSLKTARVISVGLLMLMISMLAMEIYSTQTPVKENYADAAAYLNAHVKPQDAVILSAPFTLYPIEYYYKAPVPLTTLPIWNQFGTASIPTFSEAALPGEATTLTQNAQNVWVLLSYDQGYEQNIRIYFDTHYARLYTHEFSPGLTLYEYQLRYGSPAEAAAKASPKT